MIEQYLKKTLDFEHFGVRLRFQVTQDLFSSHQIDVGTARLLRALHNLAPGPYRRVLDLGCGYGPLGLTLSTQNPESTVDLVDRDALALRFAAENAQLNQLSNAEVYGSLGYDDVRAADYDLIIANIPGKAGEAVIASLLLDARHFLAPEGLVALVIVAPLAEWVSQTLRAAQIQPLLEETRSGHALFFYRPGVPPDSETYHPGIERGLYDRAEVTLETRVLSATLRIARGLPEFDSLSYASQLLLDELLELQRPVNTAVVMTPGQGYLPVVIAKRFPLQRLDVVDRDLLALRFTQLNLDLNRCAPPCLSLAHQVGLAAEDAPPADLIVGTLREEEGQLAMAHTVAQAAQRLQSDGLLMIAAGSTAITRLSAEVERERHLRIVKRKRAKGHSLLHLRLR